RKCIEVPSDRDVLDVDLAIAASRAVTVRVAGSSGEAVAGVVVGGHAGGANAAGVQAVTDEDGVARLLLADGEASVWAQPSIYQARPLFAPERRKLLPTENDVRF